METRDHLYVVIIGSASGLAQYLQEVGTKQFVGHLLATLIVGMVGALGGLLVKLAFGWIKKKFL